MSKYKVGDKVRVRNDLKCGNVYGLMFFLSDMENLCGKVATIKEVGKCWYAVEENDKPYWTDEMFEGLVEDKKVFTKKDLKNGDVIKKRNGNVEILVLPLGSLVCEDRNFNLFDDIRDDLTSKNGKKYDIVAVRRPTLVGHCRFSAFDCENGDLVYDRERDTIRELTIEEVEKEFGIKVKRD